MAPLLPYTTASTNLNLQEKVAQCFMPAAYINDTETEIQAMEALIRESKVGGLCFFHSRASAATNFEGKKEIPYNADSLETLKSLIQRYQKASEQPLLIAIDAEYGLGMRIENTPKYPYNLTLGAIQGQTELLFEMGRNIGRDCRYAGIHYNLAPVVDINNNPDNPVIGYRSYGDDKTQITEKAKAFMAGMAAEGVASSLKHFPGHGDTATDSHLGLPIITKSKSELWENELAPFINLMEHTDSVMVGHLAVPALTDGEEIPATISKAIITELLREELGFDGIIISDALNMHGVSKTFDTPGALEWAAFDAGTDILCFSEHTAEGIAYIAKHGSSPRIEASFKRIWALKEQTIPQTATDGITDPDPLIAKMAAASLTQVVGDANTLSAFRESPFEALALGKATSTFLESTANSYEGKESFTAADIRALSESEVPLLLALYPPKVNPKLLFGWEQELWDALAVLIRKRPTVLYIFGNPYTLRLLPFKDCQATLMAYEGTPLFEAQAAAHFLGTAEAPGQLPVKLTL